MNIAKIVENNKQQRKKERKKKNKISEHCSHERKYLFCLIFEILFKREREIHGHHYCTM